MEDHKDTTGQYLYAVIDAAEPLSFGHIGIAGTEVCTVTDGTLSAVVSETSMGRIRAKRRHVAAHQEVLSTVIDTHALLPVSFGVIADNRDGVRRMLTHHRSELCEQLGRVGDKVEMSLRVNWDVPNVFEYLVHKHDELRELRDGLWNSGGQPSRDQMIEVGRLFEKVLAHERQRAFGLASRMLAGHCAEIQQNDLCGEREVMNLSCLVSRSNAGSFGDAVLAVADRFDQNHVLDYGGPWPPYSFVKLNLHIDDVEEAA